MQLLRIVKCQVAGEGGLGCREQCLEFRFYCEEHPRERLGGGSTYMGFPAYSSFQICPSALA